MRSSAPRASRDHHQHYRGRFRGAPPLAGRLCHSPLTRLGAHSGREPLWLRVWLLTFYAAQHLGLRPAHLVERRVAFAGRCKKAALGRAATRAIPPDRGHGAIRARGSVGTRRVAGGPARCQGAGRSSQPRQERVPGQYEPRDPHPNERHHRHDRAPGTHPARISAAQLLDLGAAVGGIAAVPAQRYPRLLQSRSGALGLGGHRIRLARRSGHCRADASYARSEQKHRAGVPHPRGRTRPLGRRPAPLAPSGDQLGGQCRQVYRGRRGRSWRCSGRGFAGCRGPAPMGARYRDRDCTGETGADIRLF